MEQHGSESFFVIGEGLLGETAGGREPTLPSRRTSRRSPRRFASRGSGPKGTGKQLNETNRKKIGSLMAAGTGGQGQIPAGFTYLGQFTDHDLTFDKTSVTLGTKVSPAQLVQARSPSLDLDSLYGAGPADPESAKFYEADGLHLRTGKSKAAGGFAALDGFDLPRGAGTTNAEKRTAIIPDPRNDENLAVAQTHCAMIRFHNRVVDTQLGGVPQSQKFITARKIVTKHYQWMLRTRLPAADLRLRRRQRRLHERPQGVRGRGTGDTGSDDADRVLRRLLSARPLDGPRRLPVEQGLRRRLREPGRARVPVRVLGARRRPRRRDPPPQHLARRLSPPL